jgi:hypothetical protein
VRTFGIDLSADPARTGACSIDWDAGAVSFLLDAGDAELVPAAVASDMTAIDVPLGWPDQFVEAIRAHDRALLRPAGRRSTGGLDPSADGRAGRTGGGGHRRNWVTRQPPSDRRTSNG